MSDVGFLSRLSLTSARRGSRGSPYAQRARPNSPLTRRKGAIRQRFKIDEIAKSRKSPFFVMPANAGIQAFQPAQEELNSAFHQPDDFLRFHQH
jgi:hypothetical protein